MCQTDFLSDVQLSGGGFTAGVGDAEAGSAWFSDPYYYVSANITSVQLVPEPGTLALLGGKRRWLFLLHRPACVPRIACRLEPQQPSCRPCKYAIRVL